MKKILRESFIAGLWLLAVLLIGGGFFSVLSGCSNFESFTFRLPLELEYGNASLEAERDVAIAEIDGHTAEAKAANEPHTVAVTFPPEFMPAVESNENAPPVLAPGASGMATMNDGRTLRDCVETKGGTVECLLVHDK